MQISKAEMRQRFTWLQAAPYSFGALGPMIFAGL